MLHTELKTNSANTGEVNVGIPKTDKQADIVKRLEELNKWQEEQKKLLEDRQIKQRQMLGMEQQTLYKMLGLQNVNDLTLVEEIQNGNELESLVYQAAEHLEEYTDEDTEESVETSQFEEDELNKGEAIDKELQSCRTLSSGCDSENFKVVPQTKPKKTFLRKGEGLKQRFKIDPDELKLNNLPKYKFANAHPNLRLKPSNKFNKTNSKTKSSKPFNLLTSKAKTTDQLPTLDVHEMRFQNLLISSKNTCSSTPDTKKIEETEKTLLQKGETVLPKKFNETKNQPGVANFVAWSKILDPLEIEPLSVPRICKETLPQTEESIFELLEQKAQEGSFDMESSCLKEFMTRRIAETLNESDDAIPVKEQIKSKRLEPIISSKSSKQEASNCSSDDESQVPEDVESIESDDRTHETVETTNSQNQHTPQVRVRFSDSNETHEYENDTETTADNTHLTDGASQQEYLDDTSKNDLFTQFKQALFAALQVKADRHLADDSTLNSASDITLTNKNSTSATNNNSIYSPAYQELQEKTDMIKVRLAELEKEIKIFKDNNIILLKAKQEHELQKSLNAQEHLEAMERLNDEKIRMEIYLHDERVKLEDEKRQFEQNVKMKNQSLISKERKECERLKEHVNQLEIQLKSKENNHTAAQARLRTQIRNLEREQCKLHEQIENLMRENKRLENENLKINREQNNKILLEINRNIAKLAPKQIQHSTIPIPDEGPPTLGSSKTVSKCIVAAATANKNADKTHRTISNRVSNVQSVASKKTPQRVAKETETTSEQKRYQKQNMNSDEEDEDEDDVLSEFQMTPEKRNNTPPNVSKAKPSPPKDLPQGQSQVPAPPPSSPRLSGGMNMKREIVNADGSKDIWYPNGNLKKISPDGMIIRMLYYNKDIKETNINEGTVKYYYAETNTWHTSYLDGLEILEFPNGQVEHRHKGGVVEVHYPNNSVKIMNPNDEHKQEEWRFPDGTHLVQMRNGDKILSLPNGQKEIHNKLHKRREYPDGTVKIVYPDGSTETRYSNGRVRLKDKDGKLVMDTDLAK